MTAQELDWMGKAAFAYPALANVYNLATALAWNKRTAEAQKLVNKLQGISSPLQYGQMRALWQNQARQDAALAAVSWPD